MREENGLFSMLLPLKKLNNVYYEIGNTIRNDIDITSYGYNTKALYNSVRLLIETGIICKEEGLYKKKVVADINKFDEILMDKIMDMFSDEIYTALKSKLHMDLSEKKIYFDKNAISLKYSGLMMLLEEYGEIVSVEGRWDVIGGKIRNLLLSSEKNNRITIEELEKRLLREKELGAEAEELVLCYEKEKLSRLGIDKEPIQISLIDVGAGYDILSYDETGVDEKYIEVKSCDGKMEFHFSQNEILMSKTYRNKYWLYLVNRINKTVMELCDPFNLFFLENADEWALEPDGYVIHRI